MLINKLWSPDLKVQTPTQHPLLFQTTPLFIIVSPSCSFHTWLHIVFVFISCLLKVLGDWNSQVRSAIRNISSDHIVNAHICETTNAKWIDLVAFFFFFFFFYLVVIVLVCCCLIYCKVNIKGKLLYFFRCRTTPLLRAQYFMSNKPFG